MNTEKDVNAYMFVNFITFLKENFWKRAKSEKYRGLLFVSLKDRAIFLPSEHKKRFICLCSQMETYPNLRRH